MHLQTGPFTTKGQGDVLLDTVPLPDILEYDEPVVDELQNIEKDNPQVDSIENKSEDTEIIHNDDLEDLKAVISQQLLEIDKICSKTVHLTGAKEENEEEIVIKKTESESKPKQNDEDEIIQKKSESEFKPKGKETGAKSNVALNRKLERFPSRLYVGKGNAAQEPWPKDAKLFQPYEVEQILLPDNANCLAVQAFLKMCDLDFTVESRANAEAMSPSGKVPFLKAGAFLVSELEGIVSFVNNKGISLTEKLDPEMKADMRAYMTLIHNVIEVAELYICWVDKETYHEVTSVRNGSIYPWPLNHFQNRAKRNQVIKKLKVLDWYKKSLGEVFQEVENCCQALSDRLEGKEYFFGNSTEIDAFLYGHIYAVLTTNMTEAFQNLAQIVKKFIVIVNHCRRIDERIMKRHTSFNSTLNPTELDALVFGHLFTILTTPLPRNDLANTIRKYPILLSLVQKIEKQYFKRDD